MLKDRIKKLREVISGFDSVLISDSSDIFYYTGFEIDRDEMAFLVVGMEGRPELCVSPLVNEAKLVKGVDVVYLKKLADLKNLAGGKVGFDETSLGLKAYFGLRKGKRMRPAGRLIKSPRIIKDYSEIGIMETGANIDKKIFSSIRPEKHTEVGIATDVERQFLNHGGHSSFGVIVASGKNSGFIHYRPKGRKIGKSDLTVVDFGIKLDGYCTDMTRTFCKKPGKGAAALMESVKNIQEQVIDIVHAGVKFDDLQKVYEKLMERKGYNVMHSIGHGVGLDVHERPGPGDVLEENMVITVEPGAYMRFGGCRIEDMVLVKKDKGKVL